MQILVKTNYLYLYKNRFCESLHKANLIFNIIKSLIYNSFPRFNLYMCKISACFCAFVSS